VSKIRNAPKYEAKHRRFMRLLRWPTRGGEPASLTGFHRPHDPRVVQGAMRVEVKLSTPPQDS
jgi:hypothetical protein